MQHLHCLDREQMLAVCDLVAGRTWISVISPGNGAADVACRTGMSACSCHRVSRLGRIEREGDSMWCEPTPDSAGPRCCRTAVVERRTRGECGLVEKTSGDGAESNLWLFEQPTVKIDVRDRPIDSQIESALGHQLRAPNRSIGGHDELSDHRVVVGRNLRACFDRPVPPNLVAGGHRECFDPSRLWEVVVPGSSALIRTSIA